MTRVRRRRVIDLHRRDIDPDLEAARRLHIECRRASAHREATEAGRWANPDHERSDDWWLHTPGIEPLLRYRELCHRGVWQWDTWMTRP
jgi:hypothetical protein